ncbi:MAG: MFS transporter [Thalassococcus sp.]|uniref:MFS transporter n=1 Tax=Thalassococcus sp. TaxID=1928858 RepID=UPI001B14BE6D|nr:MFS transporter [Thalassococcus sp.]MBO6868530.1 MFS transporter [Thalassococcus sp.]
MLEILKDRSYRHLFLAQLVALLGTGLATVALGLLAFDLAGESAAMVLATILTLKMVVYVTIAPVAGAFAGRFERRKLLVVLNLIRAGAAVCLPFVTEVWQVYILIIFLQSASAVFTPTFQATIPDVLPDEEQYTNALSMSRLAYDLENIISPTLAALLLTLMSSGSLFWGTAIGFVASAFLVLSVVLPSPKPSTEKSVYARTFSGIRIYLATPRLRGLLGLNLSVAAAGAMVLINSVVLVRSQLGLGESALAWTLFAFGAGSMIAALVIPKLLKSIADRTAMMTGAVIMIVALLSLTSYILANGLNWPVLLLTWLIVGLGYSTVQTPAGRLLRRSAHAEDRPALFAAQFALSHACWLGTYPLSGWLMTEFGTVPALLVLAGLTVLGLVIAMIVWPAADPVDLPHQHTHLPPDHPHLESGVRHSHAYVIDNIHRHWPDANKNAD